VGQFLGPFVQELAGRLAGRSGGAAGARGTGSVWVCQVSGFDQCLLGAQTYHCNTAPAF
jgi:hypothetical protein